MNTNPRPSDFLKKLLPQSHLLAFAMGVAALILHIIVMAQPGGGYGIFRDELYYLACAKHLDWGYVDQPPFSIWVLHVWVKIFGDSVFSIRFVPTVFHSLTVFFVGAMVIRLNGGRYAQFLACLCSFSLINLAMTSYYSMNAIDIFIWTLTCYIIILIIEEQKARLWVWLGIVLGIGLLNKIGVLFLGTGVFLGLILTSQRKWLATPWPYVAGLIAGLLFLPYIIWNAQHDWAHLEFIRNASGGKYAKLDPLDFLQGQILLQNPVALLIWIPGLLALLFHPFFRPYRWLAFLYIGPFLVLILNKTSKAEYLAPAYGVLWTGGAIYWERITTTLSWKVVPRTLLPLLYLLVLTALLPMVLTILPVERFISYSKQLGIEPSTSEDKELADLPQFYADMFGWEEKARDVAMVFNTLTEAQKKDCAIFGNNYGRCGAIDYFGPKYGLPPAVGQHNNYWIWGPRNYTGEWVIIMGGKMSDHIDDFETG